jgi:hypothetical protein
MIDVSHRGTSELSQHFAHGQATQVDESSRRDDSDAEIGEEEAAWLQEVQNGNEDDVTAIEGLNTGPLVLDIGQLRDEQTSAPSAAKRSLKGGPPT